MKFRKRNVILEMQHVLKGEYPQNVPLAEGVDLATLTEGDDNPMFLTLPIAAETTSRNGVKYQRKDVERIVSAINNRGIIGQKGHLTEAERSYRFDMPSLFWVGATLDKSGVAWGKAYIPRTAPDVREYVRVAKAMNAKVGTSIYGCADVNEAGEIVGDSLTLEQIDLVNPSRVGVIQATGVPIITQETVQSDTVIESTEEKSMDPKTQPKSQEENQGTLSELEKKLQSQVEMLTTRVRELTIEATQNAPKLTAYNRIFEMLGKPEEDDIQMVVQARLLELEALKRENLALLESAMQLAIAEKVVVEKLRPLILEMVREEKPASKSDMKVAIDKVLARESVKIALKAATIAEMGPAQERPIVPNGDNEVSYFVFPEDK